MRQRWILPAVILVMLLAAYGFRWDTEAQKTYTTGDYAVVKWDRDRWTGKLWIRGYGRGTMERLATDTSPYWASDEAKVERDRFTNGWRTAMSVSAVWLLWSLRPVKRAATGKPEKTEAKAVEG